MAEHTPRQDAGDEWPTAQEQPEIQELAQRLLSLAQSYGRERGVSFAGALSAMSTAAGALMGLAYTDAGKRREVSSRFAKASLALADMTAFARSKATGAE